MRNYLITGLTIAGLAGCGGSSTGPVEVRQLNPQSGFLAENDVIFRRSNDGTKVVVEVNGEVYVITPTEGLDLGSFEAGLFVSDDKVALGALSVGPNSVAGVANYGRGGEADGTWELAAGFARKTAFDKPTSGRATATGDYIGLLAEAESSTPAEGIIVSGDVTLNAERPFWCRHNQRQDQQPRIGTDFRQR